MRIHTLAVGVLTLLAVLAFASADDIKIMGLTETTSVRSDPTRPLAYLIGSCQKKAKHMQCHLNEIEVKKIDTTPLADKAKEVMEQVTQDPQNAEQVIASQMPYLCQEPVSGQGSREETSPRDTFSPAEKELRQATQDFCAEKSADNLHTLFDLWGQMQARTCAVWVNSYTKDFTLRDKEWVSTQRPPGPCGLVETAVFSSPLYNSTGQEIRFNRYRIQQRVPKDKASLCQTAEAKEYVFVLEKPRYAECVYLDFSPWTFGWSFWQPRSP